MRDLKSDLIELFNRLVAILILAAILAILAGTLWLVISFIRTFGAG